MLRKFILVSLLVAVGPIASKAQEVFSVGRCPHRLEVHLDGVWRSANKSSSALENFRSNRARKSVVAVVFERPEDGSYFSIGSLASLEAFQGNVSNTAFANIKAAYVKALRSIPKEVHDRAKALSDGTVTGNRLKEFDISSHFDDHGNEFVVYGTTTVSSGDAIRTFVTAQRTSLKAGCVVTMNFGFPAEIYDLGKVASAVWSVELQ